VTGVLDGLVLLAGVLLGLGAPQPPSPSWQVIMAAAVAAGVCTPLRRAPGFRVLALAAVGLLLVAVSVMRWHALALPTGAAHTRALVEARVLDVPLRAGADVRFDAEVRLLEGPRRDARPRRARLVWREPATVPRAGERWRLVVRIAPLAELRNFAGIDHERIAFRDRIHFAARVLPAALNARVSLADASIDGLRARVAARIADDVADPDAAALLTALAVGLDDRLSRDQWRVFNATGTTHLVAISGLHVTLFALAAFFCARRLWRWLPPVRRVARETFALAAGCAAAGGYALLAGFSVPAQRTWLMLGVFVLARLQARHSGAGRVWSTALIAVLLLDPLAPLAAGFWLSFVAAGVILWSEATTIAPRAHEPGAAWPRALRVLRLQLAVMLALAPLTIAVFGSVSIAGATANLVAIPVISLLLVPLVLLGASATLLAPEWSTPAFTAAASLVHWAWPALVWMADAPLALARVVPPAGWCAVAVVAGALAIQRWPGPLRGAGLVLALPLLAPMTRLPPPAVAHVTVLDAGRGSAALVVTRSHVLLFDTGDTWNSAGGRARQVVAPALDALALPRVDMLVLPALDPDRAAGAAWLAHERGVGRIVAGGGWPGATLPALRCADGAVQRDGVELRLFAAGGRCALRVSAGGRSLLLGGDLDAAGERALAARAGLASDAVVVSHRVSAVASSREWIEAVAAPLVIAAGGTDSAARQLVLERWRRSGALLLDTRRDGAIELRLGTDGVQVLRKARSDGYPFAWRRSQ
jgi:competence protein ComEC